MADWPFIRNIYSASSRRPSNCIVCHWAQRAAAVITFTNFCKVSECVVEYVQRVLSLVCEFNSAILLCADEVLLCRRDGSHRNHPLSLLLLLLPTSATADIVRLLYLLGRQRRRRRHRRWRSRLHNGHYNFCTFRNCVLSTNISVLVRVAIWLSMVAGIRHLVQMRAMKCFCHWSVGRLHTCV